MLFLGKSKKLVVVVVVVVAVVEVVVVVVVVVVVGVVDVSTITRTISCNQNAASRNGDWRWVSHEQLPPVVAEYVVGYLTPLVLISLHLCLVLLSDLSDRCKHFAHRTAIQVGRLH
jgi:hypothetical protein